MATPIEPALSPPFIFADDTPEEIRVMATPHLQAVAGLVPRWCRIVTVRFTPGAAENTASCSTDYDYRNAVLFLHGGWLQVSEHERRQAITHEVLHVMLAPLADWSRDNLEQMPHGELRDYLLREFGRRAEMTVQDLAFYFVPPDFRSPD